jgi:hypothetical protein
LVNGRCCSKVRMHAAVCSKGSIIWVYCLLVFTGCRGVRCPICVTVHDDAQRIHAKSALSEHQNQPCLRAIQRAQTLYELPSIFRIRLASISA